MTGCPFCPDNWDNLDIVDMAQIYHPPWAIIRPLNPVTDGHVLAISAEHTPDAAADPDIAARLTRLAARYIARNNLQANIITSIGPAATQTVMHTHVHVIPRRDGDGLTLPWTGQTP